MRIGIDLGGTKIEVLVLGDHGEEVFRHRLPTPKGDYQGILKTIQELISLAESPFNKKLSVGIGIPGTMRKNGLVKNANATVLIGKPFGQDLESILGRPVRIANDANCFVLSESQDGAAAGSSSVFGAILGTGCGGGLVIDGKIVNGANGIAGEWGHNSIAIPDDHERPGPLCHCGRHGCTEMFISGTGFALDYEASTKQNLCGPDIVKLAKNGDKAAQTCIQRLEHRIAKSLAVIINILDPDTIVLGGGLSNLASLYENVPKLWAPYIYSDEVVTKLVPAKYGDSSGVRGAAWLWEPSP